MNETCPKCGAEQADGEWSCGNYYEGYFYNGDQIETRLIETAGCLRRQRDQLKAALTKLMPFVLEDYQDDLALPPYFDAVEEAKRLVEIK